MCSSTPVLPLENGRKKNRAGRTHWHACAGPLVTTNSLHGLPEQKLKSFVCLM
jgi:hypothetical protein